MMGERGSLRFDDYASKRISFVLPTKNRAEQLREALGRCRDLVGPEDELIVIDGGSDDDTAQVVEEFLDIVDTFISEPDVSGPEAYNKGFLLAKGKYIKGLQDDDVFYPKAMERAVEVMEETPELDLMVCGGTRLLEGKENFIYVPPGSSFGRSVDDVHKYTRSGVGFFFRRRLLHRVGLYETESAACDAALLIRSVSLKADVRFCRINMFYHPLNEDSHSVRNEREKYAERDWLIRKYCSEQFKKEWFRRRSLPWRALRAVRRLAATGRLRQPPQERPAPVWDGGFS
jgi:glycosyltransferase involved in cell wall biosynthesis